MQNASQKKVNGEISIQNGDFSVQIFQQRIFQKKMKTLLKKVNGEISIQNGDFSIHFFLRSVLHQFFQKK